MPVPHERCGKAVPRPHLPILDSIAFPPATHGQGELRLFKSPMQPTGWGGESGSEGEQNHGWHAGPDAVHLSAGSSLHSCPSSAPGVVGRALLLGQENWVRIPHLPLTSCMTLTKFFNPLSLRGHGRPRIEGGLVKIRSQWFIQNSHFPKGHTR